MPKGKVYLVGAGPGDVELITLKGYKLLCQADVVLHDHLIPAELLQLAKPGAEIISVGKFAGQHTMRQDRINALLIEKAKEHKTVLRLKGGDPFLFGRGGEEAEACAEAGVDFEVVPGITSALAVPSYAGIPPTHRDFTPNVAIVTGHRKEGKEIEIPNAGTIIFLMGVSNIQKIVNSLLGAGWPPQAKIAAVENGTLYNQRVITGTLEDFVQIIQDAGLSTPAIFIVGQVVELHEKLNWFGKKPRILVLGTNPERYMHLGTIVHRPIVECVDLEDYSEFDVTLKDLRRFNWLIFTSSNGVRFFFTRLHRNGLDTRALGAMKVAAIGKATAQQLMNYGILADLVPEWESSAGLLEEFSKLDMQNKRVLIPRATMAPSELPRGLIERGAEVEEAPVYQTVETEPADVDFDHIDHILFTSGSTVRAFTKKFGRVPSHIKAYCLGRPTQTEAAKHGIEAEIITN
ncbi:MAG: uroporphyrinogen-III C-methyltransferase [Sedimentisphaerales bacterium]|nr:uroporphyrinogen-III C-methyltransferase [Sedimentisphaerales bacterium]